MRVRRAEHDDYDDVVAFTEDTWPDREGTDYVPRVFHDWVDGDGPRQRTFVLDADGDVAGLAQGVLLSDWEAWAQGMRVNPDYRGRGVSPKLTYAIFDWAAEQGATVCRNMVFSWNAAGLGQSRATGFAPVTEFRWATPEPDPDADPELAVSTDPEDAWAAWHDSDARAELSGLALDLDESWALAELTRERLREAESTLAVAGEDGVEGMAYRVRTFDHEDGDGTRHAEYGVGAWTDLDAARSLFAAVARDAAAAGAEATRVLIPETARHVSDVARVRAGFSDEPDFVLAADLTAR